MPLPTGANKRVTTHLIVDYKHTNMNITGDNWFSSVPLVEDLLQNYGLTYVGTLRDKKTQVPALMTNKTVIKKGCTAFLFDTTMTTGTFT